MAWKRCLLLSWAWAFLSLSLVISPLLTESRSIPPSHLPKGRKHHHHQHFEFIKKLEGCHKGETVKGLHKLKQYLDRFGYLKGDHDDSFDDSLESAIKSYQLNYHLNITGQLDPDTVKKMMRPRCGVPDLINGTLMQSRKGRHLGSIHDLHTVSRYSFFLGQPRWPQNKNHLTYGFLPGVQVIDMRILISICSSAFAKWQRVSHFTFSEAQNVDSADIKIGFFSGDHNDGYPFKGIGNELAHAFAPTDGRLHFDADENWGINPTSAQTVDLESVAVHEIGHLLGLNHSLDESAVMYAYFNYGMRKVDLVPDDIQGIRDLYDLN